MELYPAAEGGESLAGRDGVGVLHGDEQLGRGHHRDRDVQRYSEQREFSRAGKEE